MKHIKSILAGFALAVTWSHSELMAESANNGQDLAMVLKSIAAHDRQTTYRELCRIIDGVTAPGDARETDELMGTLFALLEMFMTREMRHVKMDVMTARDQRDILADRVEMALKRIGSANCIPRVVDLYGKTDNERLKDRLKQFMAQLGGTIPAELLVPKKIPPRIMTEEEQREIKQLETRLTDPNESEWELWKIIKRLGEIGGMDQSKVMIRVVEQKGGSNGLRTPLCDALGQLGGSDARTYLKQEITRPMAGGENLKDRENDDVTRRAQAACALGECGEPEDSSILTQLSKDTTQYDRFRDTCRAALGRIEQRHEQQRMGNRP